MSSSIAAKVRLFTVADSQHGCFTTKQAIGAGYDDAVHGYHARRGNWVRLQRGIYRLARYPESPAQKLVLWSLWSRGRDDVPQGTFSHETAQWIHAAAQSAAGDWHMTVPRRFRKGSRLPARLILHKADLSERDIDYRGGYSVTSRDRTIRDLDTRTGRGRRRRVRELDAADAAELMDVRPVPPARAPAKDWAVWDNR